MNRKTEVTKSRSPETLSSRERYILTALEEANMISQGDNILAVLALDYFRFYYDAFHGVDHDRLQAELLSKVVSRFNHGGHLSHTSSGGEITHADMEAVVKRQIVVLTERSPEYDEYDLKEQLTRLVKRIAKQDKHWHYHDRNHNKYFSMLLKMIDGNIIFQTEEFNQMAMDIRSLVQADKYLAEEVWKLREMYK